MYVCMYVMINNIDIQKNTVIAHVYECKSNYIDVWRHSATFTWSTCKRFQCGVVDNPSR
jgi:hypothetical protein